jgi:hypothetical protein
VPRRRPTRVGEVLSELLPATVQAGRLRELGRIWPEVAGEAIARETWPSRLTAEDALVVHCSSAVWASELTMLAGQLTARLAAAAGPLAPTTLTFRVGQRPPVVEPPRRTRRHASPTSARAAAALASTIADEDVRRAAERAIAGFLERPLDEPHSA